MRVEKTFNASDIWNSFDTSIWDIERIIPDECFYPVYRWKNFVSYSPLKLLELKGSVSINPQLNNYLHDGIVTTYLPSHITIDSEIERVGGPSQTNKLKITTQTQLIGKIASALVADARAIEARHPNSTIFIYVGGKDSLNLLLIPWKNQVVAISGEPNYPLVVEFCANNNFKIPVVKLGDETSDTRQMAERECLVNCCRSGLAHVRWSQSIHNLINCEPFSVSSSILICGSLGDVFLTPHYKHYTAEWPRSDKKATLFQRALRKYLPATQKRRINSTYLAEMWHRGAQWQGIFHGIIRESIGIPNYSAYHGRAVLETLASTDLAKAVIKDVRPEIGSAILGRVVVYPSSNPSPGAWHSRDQYSSMAKWAELVRHSTNIKIS